MVNNSRNIYFIISVSIFLLADIVIGQNTNFDKVLNALENQKFKTAEIAFNEIDTAKISLYDKGTWLYYNAKFQSDKDNQHLAYKNILEAKKIFKSLNEYEDASDCNHLLFSILSHQNNLNTKIDLQKIIDEEYKRALKKNDSTALRKTYFRFAEAYLNLDNGKKAIEYFRKIISIAEKQKDSFRLGSSYSNIGMVYKETNLYNLDSAYFYTKKAEMILKNHSDNQSLAYLYNNLGGILIKFNNCEKGIQYYIKADSLPFKKNKSKSKIIFYKHLAKAYRKCKDYKNASLYLEKLNNLKDSVNDTQQNIAISKIKEKFDNEKLRADNLESESKRKQNRNLLYGSLALLLFGGVTTTLFLKNSKRKRLLAEKNNEIEQQKVITLLKEQELTSIDAMIEGQEKERKRIAEDLHDDLGSVLTTLKLHFENYKINKEKKKFSEDELIDKTDALLDEAYKKVRSIAHAKNSGVIANQGLLLAIENMAEKVSSSKKIEIEVVNHGLENRLENSLELTIFRIIQELITNIIKHAEATQATIHLINHEKSLNIMVEDNGKGFDTSQISNKGMGIHSIDKRIEHLDGTMTIESEINKGTTIIIDIPI